MEAVRLCEHVPTCLSTDFALVNPPIDNSPPLPSTPLPCVVVPSAVESPDPESDGTRGLLGETVRIISGNYLGQYGFVRSLSSHNRYTVVIGGCVHAGIVVLGACDNVISRHCDFWV